MQISENYLYHGQLALELVIRPHSRVSLYSLLNCILVSSHIPASSFWDQSPSGFLVFFFVASRIGSSLARLLKISFETPVVAKYCESSKSQVTSLWVTVYVYYDHIINLLREFVNMGESTIIVTDCWKLPALFLTPCL